MIKAPRGGENPPGGRDIERPTPSFDATTCTKKQLAYLKAKTSFGVKDPEKRGVERRRRQGLFIL